MQTQMSCWEWWGAQEVRSYWGPSMVPEARDLLDKPDVNTYCPATGKKLRLKDLVSVKFTRLQDEGGAKPVSCVSSCHCNYECLVVRLRLQCNFEMYLWNARQDAALTSVKVGGEHHLRVYGRR